MTKALSGVAAILIVSAGVAGCASGPSDTAQGQSCTYNGVTYPDRTSWLATDGYSECSCLEGRADCFLVPGDAGVQSNISCIYDGQTYDFGATFASTDGCNICECTWRWYHDTDPGPWEAACTLDLCSGGSGRNPLPASDASSDACVYNGKTYPTDVYFASADGCDECHCRDDGLVTCTFLHTGCGRP